MKTKNRLLMLLFLLVMNNMVLLAQVNRTVTGTVKDNKGLPVISATVNVKGSSQSTTTDENGNFSITLEKTNALLVISSIGFNTKELNSKNLTKLDVSLISSASDMNEVVVTALGVKRDKKSIGFAVQQVKIDAISIAAPVDIAQGLQGKVAGLNISTSNGLANASSRIVIRGNNSLFGNNQPLIVVDGAVLDNKSLPQSNTENSLGGYTDWGNYLSYMNMDNVDNVYKIYS